MTVKVTVSVKAAAVIASLKGFRARFREALILRLQRIAILVQSAVKENKLSGQVLHVRSGTLRRSINQRVEERGGGISAIVGTNVKYAAAHEYGFDGVVNVRAHVREIVRGSRTFVQNVRSHSMQLHLPERSFLRSTLAEFADAAKEDIARAAVQVLNPRALQ